MNTEMFGMACNTILFLALAAMFFGCIAWHCSCRSRREIAALQAGRDINGNNNDNEALKNLDTD